MTNLKELLAAKAEALKAAQAAKIDLSKIAPAEPDDFDRATLPPKKLSLKEQLEAKRKAAEQKELATEAAPVLSSDLIGTPDPITLVEEQAEPAPAPVPVIEIEGKFLSLGELESEINRLQALTAKLKAKALVERLWKLQEKREQLIELLDAQMEGKELTPIPVEEEASLEEEFPEIKGEADNSYQGAFALNISLNERQLMAKDMALADKSFCLIGAAGTGKTTAQRSVAEALLESNRLGVCNYKLQGGGGVRVDGPSFVACAFTRRASGNLARAIHKNPRLEQILKHNIMTVHALLEFEPVVFWDPEKERESMRFEPQRTAGSPLEITHLVIEEASMLGLDLWQQLYDALPLGVQIIFIGDINQLPPVFGASILNYALVQLPIIELTHVYRQQGDSLILANAHHILKGEMIEEGPGFEIIRGKNQQQVGQEKMATSLGRMFEIFYDSGSYRPDEDMILSPFNKQALGTDNMNKWIAQFLGTKRGAIVHEIIAGFNKHYLAVGDRVMVNKQDGYITKIVPNAQYHGQEPQVPGSDLSRFGVRILGGGKEGGDDLDDILLGYTDFSLEELEKELAERKQQASHIVDVVLESGQTEVLSAAGDFGPQVFSLGYVLTVHKAQGCEFRKVFGILHKDHAVMLQRELFYTMVTRAREEFCLIAKDFVIEKAIKNQKIKGDSLQDKIEYFNSGAVDMLNHISCTK